MSVPTGQQATTVDVTMPQMGVSVAEGTIVEWRKQVGDAVARDEPICLVSTDKIDVDVPAAAAGVLAEILVREGATVDVGTVLARIAVGDGTAPIPSVSAAAATPSVSDARHKASEPAEAGAISETDERPPTEGRRRGYSPVVARIAAEHGIDLAAIAGSGRGGRVTKQDVLAAVERAATPPAGQGWGPLDTPVPLSRMRRSIAEHMVRSLRTAAHCTTIVEADMSCIEAARRPAGLTYLPFVAHCVIEALRQLPLLNATLEGEQLTVHSDVNLGFAVSLGEQGLIVPVVQRAQELSAERLGERVRDLATRAREGQLSPDEVHGGTFTITNPGAFGAIAATPIINQPQVAILDLEAVVRRPVVVADRAGNEAIAIRPIANLCMSWDHRALDGAYAARFLSAVRERIERYGDG